MTSRKTMTLRDALARQKPYIPCTATDTRNSKYSRWPQVTACHWTEFSIQTLNDSYGHVLDTELPSDVVDTLVSPVVLDGITVEDDGGPQRLIGWDDMTVIPLVKWAKLHLGLQEGTALYHQFTRADQTVVVKLPHATTNATIDHAILLQNIQRHALVVGLGRTSTKWTSLPIICVHTRLKAETMWPLRQLANLCITAGTRYGYIQTDAELVVCCVTSLPEMNGAGSQHATSEDPPTHKVAVQSVPWNTEVSNGSGHNVLTTELALWWLCMLALSDGHRELVPEKELVPIDAWDTLVSNDERGTIRRHRYSQRERLANTPTPMPHATPEQGNAAANAGINGVDYPEWGVDFLNHDFGVSFLSNNI